MFPAVRNLFLNWLCFTCCSWIQLLSCVFKLSGIFNFPVFSDLVSVCSLLWALIVCYFHVFIFNLYTNLLYCPDHTFLWAESQTQIFICSVCFHSHSLFFFFLIIKCDIVPNKSQEVTVPSPLCSQVMHWLIYFICHWKKILLNKLCLPH